MNKGYSIKKHHFTTKVSHTIVHILNTIFLYHSIHLIEYIKFHVSFNLTMLNFHTNRNLRYVCEFLKWWNREILMFLFLHMYWLCMCRIYFWMFTTQVVYVIFIKFIQCYFWKYNLILWLHFWYCCQNKN